MTTSRVRICLAYWLLVLIRRLHDNIWRRLARAFVNYLATPVHRVKVAPKPRLAPKPAVPSVALGPFVPRALLAADYFKLAEVVLYATATGDLKRLAFYRLGRRFSVGEIRRELSERGWQSSTPEELAEAFRFAMEDCPNGRLLAVGPPGEKPFVVWKQKKSDGRFVLNRFRFPADGRHQPGDIVVVAAP